MTEFIELTEEQVAQLSPKALRKYTNQLLHANGAYASGLPKGRSKEQRQEIAWQKEFEHDMISCPFRGKSKTK